MLGLKPLQRSAHDQDDLQQIVFRIRQERGHFRNVTEESLQEEIDSAEDGAADQDESNTPKDREARFKQLHEKRLEMLNYIGQARVEIQTALDFTSLLLYRYKQSPGQLMKQVSPQLHEMLQNSLGTMAFDKIPSKITSPAQAKADDDFIHNANIGTLSRSADSVLGAARQLENSLQKETKYWEQMMNVKERGWTLCRLPRTRRGVGVQYGFLEAGSNFKQALAAVNSDEDGHLTLDAGQRRQPRAIRVRIVRTDGRVESSHVPIAQPSQGPLEDMVHQTRDTLFDEEVFFEIAREARDLLPYGVRLRDNVVHAPLHSFQSNDGASAGVADQLLIDLVSLPREFAFEEDEGTHARLTALALRVSLTALHHRRFETRSQTPHPLSDRKPKAPVEPFIRPVLNIHLHATEASKLDRLLAETERALARSGLPATLAVTDDSFDFSNIRQILTENKASVSIAMLRRMVTAMSKTVQVSFSSGQQVTIRLTTDLGSPCFGSQYHITQDPGVISDGGSDATFPNFHELGQYFCRIVCRDVASCIASKHAQWTREGNSEHLKRNRDSAQASAKSQILTVQYKAGVLGLSLSSHGSAPKNVGSWGRGVPHESKDIGARLLEQDL